MRLSSKETKFFETHVGRTDLFSEGIYEKKLIESSDQRKVKGSSRRHEVQLTIIENHLTVRGLKGVFF